MQGFVLGFVVAIGQDSMDRGVGGMMVSVDLWRVAYSCMKTACFGMGERILVDPFLPLIRPALFFCS